MKISITEPVSFKSEIRNYSITDVQSFIEHRIQYFSFSVEGIKEKIRIDATELKLKVGLEPNEIEYLIHEQISFSNASNFEFQINSLDELKRKDNKKLIRFEKIGFIGSYELVNKKPTRICLITPSWKAVFLTIGDFENLTGMPFNEAVALDCFIWAPNFDANEKPYRSDALLNQRVSNPTEIIFRYFDSYDKMAQNTTDRWHKGLWENRNWANFYWELKFQKHNINGGIGEYYEADEHYEDGNNSFCEACQQSPCMCSDREQTSTIHDY